MTDADTIRRNIFIYNWDAQSAISQKTLLAACSEDVVLETFRGSPETINYTVQDIFVIDLERSEPRGYVVLDFFLQAVKTPKVLITSFKDDVLKPYDTFGEKTFHILFKPFRPKDLIGAVNHLMLA